MTTPANAYEPTVWGAAAKYRDFKCPSGQLCQIRSLSLTDLMTAGLLDEMDALGPLMQSEVIDPAKGRKRPADRAAKRLTKAEAAAVEEKAAMDLIGNPEQFAAMTRLLERIVATMVVQPTVVSPWVLENGTWAKIPLSARENGVIYSDSIEFEDSVALFGEAMGDKSLEEVASFRDAATGGVGLVEDGGDV